MRIAIFCTAMLMSATGTAAAQPVESRTSASGIAGVAKTYDDEGRIGRGWLIGGSVERVLFGTTRLEGSHRFGRRTVHPYVLGGVTIGHHSGKSRFDDLSFTPSSTDAGLRFGGGVAVLLNQRFEVSPGFRMNEFFLDNDSNPWTIPSFGIRLGYRF